MAELEEKVATLENEVNTHLEALQTGQTWHEQQKRELNEKITTFKEKLTEQKNKWTQHIEQTKQQLNQEITLIKEVLID